MGAEFWNDLVVWLADEVDAQLGPIANVDDPLAIQHVRTRLIIEPNDWTDDPKQYTMPAVHIFSIRAEPAIVEQMKVGGVANDGTTSLEIVYPIYLVGAVKGTLDSTAHDARAIGKRLLDFPRGLPAIAGQLPPDDTGQRLREITYGAQNIDLHAVATTTREIGYIATVTQPIRVGSYLP